MANLTISCSFCSAQSISPPVIFGAEIIGVSAAAVANCSIEVPLIYNFNHGAVSVKGVSFCNITVTYTHPGQTDAVNVESWLPLDTWKGRLHAVVGGGWAAGRFVLSDYQMSAAIGEGYATSTTDTGQPIFSHQFLRS